MSRVVVLVLTWNGAAYIRACLHAVQQQQGVPDYGVLVVDNGSTDGTADIVASEFVEVALIRNNHNVGFAGGNNIGLQALLGSGSSAPDVIVLLNQDTEVAPDWLAHLLAALAHYPDAGIAGCKIFDLDGQTLQHTGGQLAMPLAIPQHRGAGETDTGQYDQIEPVDYVTGAAVAIRRTVLDRIGLLDEGFSPAYFEDTDFCYRARAAGFGVLYVPTATLRHAEGARSQSAYHQRIYHRNRMRFVLRHAALEQLTDGTFEAAEREEITRWSLSNSLARKQAYLDNILHLGTLLAQRSDASTAVPQQATLAAMLHRLHQHVVDEERRRRTEAVRLPDPPPASTTTALHVEAAPDEPEPVEAVPAPEPEQVPEQVPEPEPVEAVPAPEPKPEPVDVAAIMRQVRRQISERQNSQTDYDLQAAVDALNQQWDKVYEPLNLSPSTSLPGRAWEQLRTRLHGEVRSYLDPMIFRQTEFNANLVRALNNLLRRTTATASSAEVESLRDEIIQLREQVRRLQEQLEHTDPQ